MTVKLGLHRSFSRTYQRFVFRRIWKGTFGMALLYAVFGLAQSVALVKAYPTAIERAKIILSLKGSAGLDVMYGSGVKLDGGIPTYMEWRVFGFGVIFAAIWGIMVATRLFRQDEESGRQEYILSKRTTQPRIMWLTFGVITMSLLVQAIVSSVLLLLANKTDGIHFGVLSTLLFSGTIACGSLLFGSCAALLSQVFRTRKQALLWSGCVLVVCFGLRAVVATSPNISWVKCVSPFDWLQNVRPFTEKNLLWLVPAFALSAAFMVGAHVLNRSRDMGGGVARTRDETTKKSRLLSSTLASSFLFTRSISFTWAASILVFSTFISSLSRTAADAVKGSGGGFQDKLSSVLQTRSEGIVRLFLGMSFFLASSLLCTAIASLLAAVKNEEFEGRLDTILVRPVSRIRWLAERVLLICITVICIAFALGTAVWFVVPSGYSITYSEVLKAGLNILFPTLFIGGVGVLLYGIRPRLAVPATYGLIIWSLLVQVVVPLLSPTSRLLNTSVYHYVKSAPAEQVNWTSSAILGVLGVMMMVVGIYLFSRRDIQSD